MSTPISTCIHAIERVFELIAFPFRRLGGRRPSLEHHLWSPDEPNRDERQRNKQRLLAVLKDNPRIPGRSRSCPTVSEEHYDACKGSERRTISGDGDKSRRVVIDESTGRPINFDDPWGF